MVKKKFLRNQNGSILIFALWTVTFLTIFATQIGLRVQQRATFLSRIENRSRLQHIASSGVKKAISALRSDIRRNGNNYSVHSKYLRHNNKGMFYNIEIGDGVCNVFYRYYDKYSKAGQDRYGFIDEESKININIVDRKILQRLIKTVVTSDEEEVRTITNAIIDWREVGDSDLVGFYSDDYYDNLDYPYEPKSAVFEVIDELRLVRGINEDVFQRLKPFVTIYGDGMVNINTAPREVFLALGLGLKLSDKIIEVRKGEDNLESTDDDYVFQKTFDIASEMLNFVKLNINEVRQIDYLNAVGLIKTTSSYYLMESQAQLNNRDEVLTVSSIYNSKENRIEYWREK